MEIDDKTMMSLAYASFRLALNNTPFCQAVWRRMQNPKPGDLVMEYSQAAYVNPRAIGRLVRCDRSQGTGEIELSNGKTVQWSNAAFAIVPTLEMILAVEKELGDMPRQYGSVSPSTGTPISPTSAT